MLTKLENTAAPMWHAYTLRTRSSMRPVTPREIPFHAVHGRLGPSCALCARSCAGLLPNDTAGSWNIAHSKISGGGALVPFEHGAVLGFQF